MRVWVGVAVGGLGVKVGVLVLVGISPIVGVGSRADPVASGVPGKLVELGVISMIPKVAASLVVAWLDDGVVSDELLPPSLVAGIVWVSLTEVWLFCLASKLPPAIIARMARGMRMKRANPANI